MIISLFNLFFFLFVTTNYLTNAYNTTSKIKNIDDLDQPLIELNSRNLVTIRGPIQPDTVTDFISKLSKIDSKEIYIYLSSPGGSVMEGLKIVDIIKSTQRSGISVKCISDFTASMAFIILQSCPVRYATMSSVLMQHQMSLGLKGDIKNVGNYLSFIKDIDTELDVLQSEKIGISISNFREKIENDWWINGATAVEKSVVDKLVHLKCHNELDDKFEVLIVNFGFRPVHLVYSKCPFSRYPVEVLYEADDGFSQHSSLVSMENAKNLLGRGEYNSLTQTLDKWLNYKEPIFKLSY